MRLLGDDGRWLELRGGLLLAEESPSTIESKTRLARYLGSGAAMLVALYLLPQMISEWIDVTAHGKGSVIGASILTAMTFFFFAGGVVAFGLTARRKSVQHAFRSLATIQPTTRSARWEPTQEVFPLEYVWLRVTAAQAGPGVFEASRGVLQPSTVHYISETVPVLHVGPYRVELATVHSTASSERGTAVAPQVASSIAHLQQLGVRCDVRDLGARGFPG